MAGKMKTGLGRGLDALLDPLTDISIEEEEKNGSVLEINVRDIDTNREQPRKSFDTDALNELAASIKQHGIVQPLIVKKNGSRYTIVAGERRFRAARIAGLQQVPVITVDYDEEKMREVALIENIQRENLNPIEEAAAIKFLMQQHDMTQEEVSERIGKSRPAVANSLRLLNLPENVLDMVKDGRLSAGHGRAIAGVLEKDKQTLLAEESIRMGYSVRSLESRIKNMESGKIKKPAAKKDTVQTPAIADAEKNFREKLSTKVKITGDEKKGKITIEYFSKEDLQHIYECIIG